MMVHTKFRARKFKITDLVRGGNRVSVLSLEDGKVTAEFKVL